MWYYALDDERKGPVDKDEIQRLIDDGGLGVEDLVWTDGMEEWTPISEVDDLHPSPPPLSDNEESPSPPPISEEKHSQATRNPDSESEVDGPTVSSQEDDALAGRKEASSGTTKSAERTGTKTVGVTYANFGVRSVAYGVDMLITVVVSVALNAVAIYLEPSSDPESLGRGIGFLVTWFYFAGFESSKRQATPGKRLMNLKVTDMNRSKIGFGKATGRHFGKILSGLIFLIGFIMAAFTEKGQALHDKMAGCLIIEGPVEDEERRLDTEKKGRVEEGEQEVGGKTVDGVGDVHVRRTESSQPQTGKFNPDDYEKECPSCTGYIKLEASGCRYCGYKFSSEEVKRQIGKAKRPGANDINPSKIKAVNDGENCAVCGERCANWGNPQIRVCEICIEIPGVQERVNKFDYS